MPFMVYAEICQRFNPYPSDHDYCRFNLCDLWLKSLLLGIKCVSKYQDLQIFLLKLNKHE